MIFRGESHFCNIEYSIPICVYPCLSVVKKTMNKKKVVIIGMGFGGLKAADALANQDVEVLFLDRRNFHLFQPLLYQVATAMLEQENIAYNTRALVRNWPNVNFQMSDVEAIDMDAKIVKTPDGNISYDYLIVSAGSVTNFFGNDSVRQNAFDLKQLEDAVVLRNHILGAYELASKEADAAKRQALMTFVVVGGGPTGVEFSGALAELTHTILVKDYPRLDVKKSRVILVESGQEVLSMFPKRLQKYAARRLQRMGVHLQFGSYVTGAQDGKVLFKDGSSIDAQTLFWAAGVKAAPLAEMIVSTKARNGRVVVEKDLSLKEHAEVSIIGDMAYFEQDGQPLPMVAPPAMQGGTYVAHKILATEKGETVAPFHYVDKGSMAVIGRGSAVASVKNIHLQGFFAWLAWLGLHLFYLVGFRNRVLAVVNWAYSFFSYDSQVRLITRAQLDGDASVAPHEANTPIASATAGSASAANVSS